MMIKGIVKRKDKVYYVVEYEGERFEVTKGELEEMVELMRICRMAMNDKRDPRSISSLLLGLFLGTLLTIIGVVALAHLL